MLSYLEKKDEKLCCGCRACEQICPKEAITFQKNDEGFIYPTLNEELCVNCKLCDSVCPVMNRPIGEGIQEAYAIQHKNDDLLKKSSSGGAFRLLADEMLRQGGYVVGCIWDKNYQPILTIAQKEEELYQMQGSKYLFSDTKNIYSQVKQLLNSGKSVLFTGTPCQCAGLLKFLRKPYENLFTADFVCHGVPSQSAFDSYLKTLRDSENITSYQFRDKEKRGWGIVSSYTYPKKNKIKKHYSVGMTNPYIFGFLNGYFNRYSCYSCSFRGEKRFTDFTFCDYWGIEESFNINSQKGVSAITLNSQKACTYFEKIKNNVYCYKTDGISIAKDNPSLLEMTEEKIPFYRKTIYQDINQKGWKSIERKQLRCKNRILKIMWYSIPLEIADQIKKIVRR